MFVEVRRQLYDQLHSQYDETVIYEIKSPIDIEHLNKKFNVTVKDIVDIIEIINDQDSFKLENMEHLKRCDNAITNLGLDKMRDQYFQNSRKKKLFRKGNYII